MKNRTLVVSGNGTGTLALEDSLVLESVERAKKVTVTLSSAFS